jgi:hypothetical protein
LALAQPGRSRPRFLTAHEPILNDRKPTKTKPSHRDPSPVTESKTVRPQKRDRTSKTPDWRTAARRLQRTSIGCAKGPRTLPTRQRLLSAADTRVPHIVRSWVDPGTKHTRANPRTDTTGTRLHPGIRNTQTRIASVDPIRTSYGLPNRFLQKTDFSVWGPNLGRL